MREVVVAKNQLVARAMSGGDELHHVVALMVRSDLSGREFEMTPAEIARKILDGEEYYVVGSDRSVATVFPFRLYERFFVRSRPDASRLDNILALPLFTPALVARSSWGR